MKPTIRSKANAEAGRAPEVVAAMHQAVADLRASDIVLKVLKVGF